jgi:phosphoesterase RecJ-like protein
MVERGVEPDRLYSKIYQRNPPELPHEMAALLARLEYYSDGRLAVLAADPEGGPFDGNSDLLLDVLRSVDGIEVVLFLRVAGDGRIKLSARSKGDFDVNALAREFGGGGHVKASGATLEGPMEQARGRLVEAALAHIERHFGSAAR